jgi:hypothetical protein
LSISDGTDQRQPTKLLSLDTNGRDADGIYGLWVGLPRDRPLRREQSISRDLRVSDTCHPTARRAPREPPQATPHVVRMLRRRVLGQVQTKY